ncbi:MAG: hypothetical protein R6U40_12780 [Desulfobacterales bacterium]
MDRYKECIRMLNELEKKLERKVPERERLWQLVEETAAYSANDESFAQDGPITTENAS